MLRSKRIAKILLALQVMLFGAGLCCTLFAEEANAEVPGLTIQLKEGDQPDDYAPAIKILGVLTVLSVAPAILLMMTSFTRILVVLSFVRQALGTQTMPPNQVVVGLAFFLTLFTMAPIIDEVKAKAWDPYVAKTISQDEAFDEFVKPVRKFMLSQTRETDLGAFMAIARLKQAKNASETPLTVLIPAFMVSELKTAFQIGFIIFIPFLVIDMVVSSILMAMGMMMLPPTVVSLPFKIVLFVLVDGWALIVENLVKSFNF